MANGRLSKNQKGKRRASRTPSPHSLSSDDSDAMPVELPATQPTRSRKKLRRQSSPERVMGSVLSKATKLPKKGTGLAALVALVATRGPAGSTAAKVETNRGMKTGGKRPKAKNNTRSNISGDGFRVGKIAFLREGVKITEFNDEGDSDGDNLQPFYSTRSEVSVNSNDLATLRQHGLCVISTDSEGFVFNSTDSHQDIDNKLRVLFPEVFFWFDKNSPVHYLNRSQWLVCSKRCNHKKGVMVNSDDRKLPDGADIIAACQGGAGKVNFMDTTLFLATREKIPTKTIQSWNFPQAKENDNSTDEDESSFGQVNEAMAGPSNLYNLRPRSGILDEDTINISSGSSSEESNSFRVHVPAALPVREGTITPHYPTPPQADNIENAFTSSLVFDRTIPNPWTTAS